ncbi:phosphatase PAP2 family protein [Streptomyces luteolifulvus]|uniref:phosphatase PAP2 family protein n=1 Tax=Streptomyces luteolifulvus TaxID=2615112 RepID=UPI001CD9CAF6|nr:phosphatase PAP2 family protein [Streptomyces luteolifulvus]
MAWPSGGGQRSCRPGGRPAHLERPVQAAGRPGPAPEGVVPARRGRRPPRPSSLPSGHTAAAVAFTATVAPTWPAAGASCAVPAAMVALERVQSGAHYPSDVAAGAAIGLASAWLTRRAPRLILRHGP